MSRVLADYLTHAHADSENHHLRSINDHFFQNKSFLFYKSKFIGQSPISTCFYYVPCVFVRSEFLGSHRMLRMPSDTFANFHRWIHMSNQEYRVFHLMRYLSLLPIPNTRIFRFLFLLCDCETHFERCPILPSPPSNTKHDVDLQCIHDIPSNTKHSVDLYHALTPMSCDVLCINAMPLHVYHATCTMNATCNSSKSYFMPSIMDNHI